MDALATPDAAPEVVDLTPETRLNALADLATLDSVIGGNPFEPTISRPSTIIQSADYSLYTLNRPALTYDYKSLWVVKRYIRQPVDDAFKGGLHIEIPEIDDPEDLKDLRDLMDERNDIKLIKATATWARLFGGAGHIIVTDQDPGKPFDPESIQKGATLDFLSADRWELTMAGLQNAGEAYERIANRQFGYSYTDRFNYYSVPLDPTRVVKLNGAEPPSLIRQRLQGWGMSELESAIREIQAYLKFENVMFELADEAKIDVYKIEQFNNLLAHAQGTALVKLRFALASWLKNYKNVLAMDAKDDYVQKQIAFSGLADMFEQFQINLCAAIQFPRNKLFGESAGGFASGEDSLENYNTMVEVEVRENLHAIIRKVIDLRCRQVFGFGPKFTFKFAPLRVLNGVEEEAVKTSKQNRALALYDRDLVDGREASEILKKEDLISIETDVLTGKREPVSPLEMQQQETDATTKAMQQKGERRAENAITRIQRLLKRAA